MSADKAVTEGVNDANDWDDDPWYDEDGERGYYEEWVSLGYGVWLILHTYQAGRSRRPGGLARPGPPGQPGRSCGSPWRPGCRCAGAVHPAPAADTTPRCRPCSSAATLASTRLQAKQDHQARPSGTPGDVCLQSYAFPAPLTFLTRQNHDDQAWKCLPAAEVRSGISDQKFPRTTGTHHRAGRSSRSSCRPRWRARLGRIGLQGGCRDRVERTDGLGAGQDLAVHQALVKLVEVQQLRLLRIPCLQQVGGGRAQRNGAEPGRVQRRTRRRRRAGWFPAARWPRDSPASRWR